MTPPTPSEIRIWLADHGLTQKELARLLPVGLRAVESWVSGKRTPPAYLHRALRDLAQELSIRRARGERPQDMEPER